MFCGLVQITYLSPFLIERKILRHTLVTHILQFQSSDQCFFTMKNQIPSTLMVRSRFFLDINSQHLKRLASNDCDFIGDQVFKLEDTLTLSVSVVFLLSRNFFHQPREFGVKIV